MQLIDEHRHQGAQARPALIHIAWAIPFVQCAQAFAQNREIFGLVRRKLDLQRDVVAGGMTARVLLLIEFAPPLSPFMRGAQSLVFRRQRGRHVSALEHIDACTDILFKQAQDNAQAPPGKIGKRNDKATALCLFFQLRLDSLVYRSPGGHGIVLLPPEPREQLLEHSSRRRPGVRQRGQIQAPRSNARTYCVVSVLPTRAPAFDAFLIAHRGTMGLNCRWPA
jgi:hypothetical protein